MSLEVANALKTPDYFVVSQNDRNKICSLSLLSSYITSQIIIPTGTGTGLQFVSVDGVTITGDGTPANPLVAIASGIGTVTSVAMSVPTGLTVTGSPITTAGTLALTLTAGYVIPTTTEETNWNTAYTNRITSLTTTGTSGASTLVANVLNIPNYATATVTPAALSKVNDTNVTLTLGGTPLTALLQATSLTLGWTGTLGTARGGTNLNTSASTGIPTITAGTWSVSTNLQKGNFGATWDGQGAVIGTGAWQEIIVPYAGTITDWVIDSYTPATGVVVSGSIIIELYRSGASIIGAGNKPTLAAASTNSAAVAGWTSTAVAAGDKLYAYVSSSPVSCLKVTCTFNITKT